MGEAEWGPVQLAFEFIRDLTIQLITLASGVVAVTVAAAERGMLRSTSRRTRAIVRVGWGLCLFSIVLGFGVMMALTGELAASGKLASQVRVPGNARLFGQLQFVTFSVGMGFLVLFAWRLLRVPAVDGRETAAVPEQPSAKHTPSGRKRRNRRPRADRRAGGGG